LESYVNRISPLVLLSLALPIAACAKGALDETATAEASGSGSGTAGAQSTQASASGTGGQGGALAGSTGGLGGSGGKGGAAQSSGAGGTGGSAGLGGELTINGDFETGDTSGWTSFATQNNGSFAATMDQAKGGSWSGNLVAHVAMAGDPISFPLVKQANLGGGIIQPNSALEISLDVFGSLTGSGGVLFAEVISEQSGGGTSKTEILSGGPLLPVAPKDWTAGWVSYTFSTTVGSNVSGGVTLLLKADCGANPNCTVNVYIDNVSVRVPL
jgi:hypothetical protein